MWTVLGVESVLADVVYWLLDVRKRVCKLEGEVVLLRAEMERLRAEVAEMRKKVRYQELVAKEARLVFSDAGDERRRKS
jgi:cell division protein FtsB